MNVIYSVLLGHYLHLICEEVNFLNLHVEYYLQWHEPKKRKEKKKDMTPTNFNTFNRK